jgi:hypothetical protein
MERGYIERREIYWKEGRKEGKKGREGSKGRAVKVLTRWT